MALEEKWENNLQNVVIYIAGVDGNGFMRKGTRMHLILKAKLKTKLF